MIDRRLFSGICSAFCLKCSWLSSLAVLSCGNSVFAYCQGRTLKLEKSSKWGFNIRAEWQNFWKQKIKVTKKMAALSICKLSEKMEYHYTFLLTRDEIILEIC